MKTIPFLKAHRALILQAAVILFVATLVTGFVVRVQGGPDRAAGGSALQIQDQTSARATGETIDLLLFHSQKGRTLAEAIKGTRSR